MQYSLPRDTFEILVETFKSKEKAEKFAKAIEKIVNFTRKKSEEEIAQKKEYIKIELKEELKKERVARELFEERFKMLDFKINILIAFILIVITFANSTFVELIKNLFK